MPVRFVVPCTVVLSLVVLGLAGCPRSSAPGPAGSSDSPGSPGAEPKWTVGMSQCNLGEPWRVQMNADVKAAAEKHPEKLKVVFKDAQNDTLKQRAHVEEFVSAGVDLLIISPKEAAPLAKPVAKAMEAGIPVVVLDRDLTGENYTCFIGGDNVQIGKAVGEWLVERLKVGKVVELKGLMTTTPGQHRHSGFREGIKGSKLEVIFEADMKWLEPDARKEMDSALARFDKIDAVFGHNDPGAHGAYLAAKAAGREKEMLFVGIDALPQEGVAYVHKGILDASFLYPTGGAEAIETALAILGGEEVPKRIVLGSRVFTAKNVAQGGEALDPAVDAETENAESDNSE